MSASEDEADRTVPSETVADDLDVTVVLVTYNSQDVLGGFLDSLPSACSGLRWQLVVADNGSADGSVAMVRSALPDAVVIETGSNLGYAAAIDLAAEAAGASEFLLITNPDVRAPAGSVAQLLDRFEPDIGILAPRVVDENGAESRTMHRAPTVSRALSDAVLGGRSVRRWKGETVNEPEAYRTATDVDWASGAFLLVRRECHDQLDGWDPRFFLYSEETDFALRAADAGWRVRYDPVCTVVHIGGDSTVSPRLYTILTVNRVRLVRMRSGRVHGALYAAVVLLAELLRSVRAANVAIHREAVLALVLPWRRPAEVRARLRTRPRTGAGGGESVGAHDPSGWVCFSAQDWWYHNRAHSDFQLMRRVAQQRPVLFVNSIGMRMPAPGRSTQVTRRIARKAASVLKFMRRPLLDTPEFHVLTPVILPFYGSERLRSLNARMVRAQVRFAARRVGIELSEAVIMVTIPTAWDVVRPMQRRALVLNRSDLHSAFEETDQDLIRGLESSLLVNSDVVLYTSHSLMETERPLSGDRAHFLDHGVDLDRFGGPVGPRPEDISDLYGPIVGFFGGLDDYVVDLALLERVARDLPETTLLLVGDATCPIDGLVGLPNVRWLGFRPYEQIPAYGAAFDVALMPWLRNDWIQHANPIKLKEYLALGLPVVSTDFPEVRHYDDVIAIAEDESKFVELVRAALVSGGVGTPQSRRQRVADSSWDDRVLDLLNAGERA